MRRIWGLAWAAAGGFGAVFGGAAPAWCAGPALDWEAPDRCPSSEAFAQRVRSNTAHHDIDDPEVHARVHVEHVDDAGWRAHVVVETPSGRFERVFDGASCEAVADAAAIIVGFSLNASPTSSTGVTPTPGNTPVNPLLPSTPASLETPPAIGTMASPSSPAVSLSSPSAPPPRDTVTSHASSSVARGGPLVRASAGADAGSLPTLAPGARAGAAWRLGLFEAGVDAAAFATERGTVAGSTSGASFSLASLSADACLAVPLRDHVVMAPCVGLAFEPFTAYQPVVVLPAAMSELALEWWPLPQLAVRAAVRGIASFSRPTFVVNGPGSGDVYRPAFAAVEPSLGLTVFFTK
jgi:hypothetical protein